MFVSYFVVERFKEMWNKEGVASLTYKCQRCAIKNILGRYSGFDYLVGQILITLGQPLRHIHPISIHDFFSDANPYQSRLWFGQLKSVLHQLDLLPTRNIRVERETQQNSNSVISVIDWHHKYPVGLASAST